MDCPFCAIAGDTLPRMKRIVKAGNVTALTNLFGPQGSAEAEWEVYECPVCGFTAQFRRPIQAT